MRFSNYPAFHLIFENIGLLSGFTQILCFSVCHFFNLAVLPLASHILLHHLNWPIGLDQR